MNLGIATAAVRTLTTTLAFALMFAWSGIATASNANDTRNRIKIRKKSRLQRQAAPEETIEFNAEKQVILAEKRRNLILDIKRFIREARDAEQAGELNLRLGSLYMEEYYALLARAQSNFEAQTEAAKKEQTKKAAPKFDNSEAMASLDKARAIYRDLVKRYPKHSRRDEMLYFYAMASLDRGLQNEALQAFKQIVESTPNSKYTPDSLVQLADSHFDANQFPAAEKYFDQIIARKYRPLMAYSVYKKGWCAYNQQRTKEALTHFKWVIQNEDSEGSGAPIRIRNEAMRDITLPFVDLKLMAEAVSFFKGYGEPYYRQGVETMANLYYEQGEYKNAISLYDLLIRLDPNHAKNPGYDINIVEAHKLKNEDAIAISRLFARLPNYLKDSNWHEINATNPKTIQEAHTLFEETARKYALQYHSEGQKTKNEALYNTAKQLYAKYIEYFPRTQHTSKIRFYLADILYKQKQFVPAADNYWLVYKDLAAGAIRDEAIQNALSALDQSLNADRKKAGLAEISTKSTSKLKDKEDESLELVPYSKTEEKFVEISTEYLEKYPKAKDAGDVLYEQAYLQYSHHDFLPAFKGFWALVQKFPKHETAVGSAYLILDIMNRRKDYPKLIAASQRFLEIAEFKTKTQFRSDVSDILRKAELKRISLMEEKGDFKEAADNYVEYTKAYGSQDEALFEKALFNASINYSKANLMLATVETQEKFLRRFPKSPLRENMILQVAKTYEILANFEKAGQYFEQFATLYPKNGQAKVAQRLAGLYYWGGGNSAKAESVMLTFLRSYPGDYKVIERDLVDLYESQGAIDKQVALLLQFRAMKGLPLSAYLAYTMKISELQAIKTGRMPAKLLEEARTVAQKYGKEISGSPKGVEAMAKLAYYFANQKEAYFNRLKLALPQNQLEANLAKKMALLKEMERDFGKIAGMGSPEWGLAAIYKMAAAYRHMAQAVLAAPVPAELTAEQIEMYRGELNKQMIKPFNEKAKNFAASCLDKAQEFNLLSAWTARCYTMAAELEPERYPLARTFFLPALRSAVYSPAQKESKLEVGSVKNYAYPFYSSAMFESDRSPANATPDLPQIYEAGGSSSEGMGAAPGNLNYRILAEQRRTILKNAYESDKPDDVRKQSTFAFLNLMRVLQPKSAAPLLLSAIQRDPTNHALHNLLALCFLETGNLPAAKVTWLALVARGVKSAALWNNLGVVANLEGNEAQAIEYFQEASQMENSREAMVNLGFVALKYRNGFEAKKLFEKSKANDNEDAPARIGLAVAQLQNRELDNAKEALINLAKKYKSDPYARLSLGYYLMDVEKENDVALKILGDFVESQSLESDLQFRQAMQEAKNGAASNGAANGELPGLED